MLTYSLWQESDVYFFLDAITPEQDSSSAVQGKFVRPII